MSIGSRIKEARLNKKFTQEELAKMIGVTKGAIANYENEVSTPKLKIMYQLFETLEVDANFLYQDEMIKLKTKNDIIISKDAKKIAMLYDKANDDDKNIIGLTLKKYEDVQVIRIAARDGQKDVELTGEQRKAIVDIVNNLDDEDDNSDI